MAAEYNYIIKLRAIYNLMILGDQDSIKELELLGINIENISYDSIRRLKSMIDIEQTNIEVYLLRQKRKEEFLSGEKFNFYKALQRYSNIFNRNIPVDITTINWIYIVKEAQELKKQYRNGRN